MTTSPRRTVLDEDERLNPNLNNLQHSLGNVGSGLSRVWWAIRKILASKQRTGAHSVIVPRSTDEVKTLLHRHDYEPGWWLSYSFRGEVINRRRPVYFPSDYATWWQSHIRGYEVPAGDPRLSDPRIAAFNQDTDIPSVRRAADLTELTCHVEPEPKEHPDIHLKYVKYNAGTKRLLDLLERTGVEYYFIPDDLQPDPALREEQPIDRVRTAVGRRLAPGRT